jgi:hypothetical protein
MGEVLPCIIRSLAEADSQDRDPTLGEGADEIVRKTRFFRRTRTGRNQHPLGFQREGGFDGDLVVAMDLHLHVHLAQILDEVVGEGIVVVDDQQHGRKRAWRRD